MGIFRLFDTRQCGWIQSASCLSKSSGNANNRHLGNSDPSLLVEIRTLGTLGDQNSFPSGNWACCLACWAYFQVLTGQPCSCITPLLSCLPGTWIFVGEILSSLVLWGIRHPIYYHRGPSLVMGSFFYEMPRNSYACEGTFGFKRQKTLDREEKEFIGSYSWKASNMAWSSS